MENRKNQTVVNRSKHNLELMKLQKGNTFKSTFQSKQAKINRITELNEKIEFEEKEIDSAECLTKILFLYLHDAAIPFFRLDKLGVYNGAINLYAQKQINNCNKISQFYSKVIGQNQVEVGGHIGNVTLLDEKSFFHNNFVGKFDPQQLHEETENTQQSIRQ